MQNKDILSKVDHTLLTQTARWEEIKNLCDEAIEFQTASVCIPACYVKAAKKYVNQKMKICTVIGFPNGYDTTESKIFQTEDALKNGADEIDMVINLGYVKDGLYDKVLKEIKEIKNSCQHNILKVIIETCLLNDDEKIKMCKVVTESGADYIKTSTGFSKSGATFEDIKLFSKYIGKNVKIKAAGGIKTLQDAEMFLKLGANRLGTSKIIKLLNKI